MTLSIDVKGSGLHVSKKAGRKSRSPKPKKTEAELMHLFWGAPTEAYFDQFTIAPVIGRTTKTLECDRWRGRGLPFRKVGGRILYKKSDVIEWLESHARVTSTSEYKQEVRHD